MRALALDVGDRRIGVALSDPTGLIASPLTIIRRTSERQDHAAIASLARENGVETVVIGLPRTLRDEIGPQAQRVMRFGDRLAEAVGVPVTYWDERFSTVEAETIGGTRRGRRGSSRSPFVDDLAAAVILQSYLDSRRPATS
ncbi:MAG TPA: Holliday junction resolvase RuvX [Chloroflexota bacterium]